MNAPRMRIEKYDATDGFTIQCELVDGFWVDMLHNWTEEAARRTIAARDMLDALEYVNAKSTIDMDDAMIDVVTAAIAKAKGEGREGGPSMC